MKYFVCSDIHGFFSIWQKALKEKGYDENNPNHKIIICGDLFDRQNENLKCYNYVLRLCKENKLIYVTGNHEDLLRALIDKKYIEGHDRHNKTDKTVYELAQANLINKTPFYDEYDLPFEDCCYKIDKMVQELEQYMIDYFETDHYIFVHSWIPTKAVIDEEKAKDKRYQDVPMLWLPYKDAYDENWRNASKYDWEEARWGNPYKYAFEGLNQTGKTIVFGHWHCSAYWAIKEDRTEFNDDVSEDKKSKWDLVDDKELGIIGLDRCTAHTNQMNIAILED